MIECLLSTPPRIANFLHSIRSRPTWYARLNKATAAPLFVDSDPAGRKLGSGGGTVNLLHSKWRQSKPGRSGTQTFEAWLASSQRLVLHAGGESRRLPAYAAVGKAFLPLPVLGRTAGRSFDQVLADQQLPTYTQTLAEAGEQARLLVSSGDVWLDFDPVIIPQIAADICGIGMRVSPEVAQHFGVFFVPKDRGGRGIAERGISFFLQKPSPTEINRHLSQYDFFVDTGLWLFSQRGLEFLLRRCGWNSKRQRFTTPDGLPANLDLYTEIGTALGTRQKPASALTKLGFNDLTSSVIPLEDARFYHLGSSRQLLESIEQIQNGTATPRRAHFIASSESTFKPTSKAPTWVEGSTSTDSITLRGYNVLTGLPDGSRLSHLAEDVCLDITPVGRGQFVVRPYHLGDVFRGKPDAGATICGQDARIWLSSRTLAFSDMKADVFQLPLYPVVAAKEITQALLDWFFAETPDPKLTAEISTKKRLAAAEIPAHIDFTSYFAQRQDGYAAALQTEFSACLHQGDTRIMSQDFSSIATFCQQGAPSLAQWLKRNDRALLDALPTPGHQSRLLLLLADLTRGREQQKYQDEAYARLQSGIVSSQQFSGVQPSSILKEDQIVWGRSPVRLDLAGGWTDTPPYCFEYGGAVVNVAVLLNGQPPIQVFIRPISQPEFRLRSIDLGSSETITTYADLEGYRDPRSGFSLPKAALALAGFQPEFLAGKKYSTLQAQLKMFGGGLEISLLCAVPKGSGLGTSSILAATVLAALNRACGLNWDELDLYHRVLRVEQLLTTGGGWQDQAGAIFGSLKLIQTQPGEGQTPSVRYLPPRLLGADYANRTFLLYYTGATRLAKGILKEIVRDMFLGNSATLQNLELIRANALQTYHAFQEGDLSGVQRAIARSWQLNKRLDTGTTTPEIEKIIQRCGTDLAACKLLGAGGGGYMLLCARDPDAGKRIREKLEAHPTNPRARFIDFSVAETGLQVTVS